MSPVAEIDFSVAADGHLAAWVGEDEPEVLLRLDAADLPQLLINGLETAMRHVRIEGNADERGTREYNLALGQKRADSMKKMLTLLGAGEDQVEAVSLGEEKPKNEGADDAAWAENRRGDMLYSGEF